MYGVCGRKNPTAKKNGLDLFVFIICIASEAIMPSVCSSSFPSAASQLSAAEIFLCGSVLKTSSSSAVSRPFGLTTHIQDGGSSRPLVPIDAGTL